MATQGGKKTLRDMLISQKPSIICNMQSGRNTCHGKWPEPAITNWDSFNLKTLDESYGHVLNVPIAESQQLPIQAIQALANPVVITDRDINSLLRWNDELMKQTLQFAKTLLGLFTGTALQYKCADVEGTTIPRLPRATGYVKVDHIISLDDYALQPLVVGLGRPSSKWSGRKVQGQTPNVGEEGKWPIRQLAYICGEAGTRYGYIQTDEEMVVCCFSKLGDDEWKAAIKPVPWSKSGKGELTTDLAIWWLCMLAMSDPHNCGVVNDVDTVDIGHWEDVFFNGGRGWVRRHRYSKVELPASLFPLPADQTPPQGSLPPFAVSVGFHPDGPFNLTNFRATNADPNCLNDCTTLDDIDLFSFDQNFSADGEHGGE